MTTSHDETPDFDPFAQGEIERMAPLTGPQREIWSGVKLGGDQANCAYNEGITLRFRGPLDEARLLACLDTLVARHESLRSTFSTDGQFMLIQAPGAAKVERVDLSGASDPDAAYRELAQREVETPFDLNNGPLFYAKLVRCAPGDHRLLMMAHHIICDGWSYGVMVSELAALYNAGGQTELELAESFSDYAEQCAEHAAGPEGKRMLRYWVTQYSASIPSLDLPLDKARPPLRTYNARRYDHTLPGALVSELRQFAKREGVSLQQVLLAGFSTLLARLTQQWDVVVGLSAAGQATSERLGLVGHCVNYLPVRTPLDPESTFRDALIATKRTMRDALDHPECTFGTLLAELPLARDPSRVPLAPVSFNLEQSFDLHPFEGLRVESSVVPRSFEVFEMFANLVDRKDRIVIETQYNTDLFDEASVSKWLEAYEALLGSAAQNAETKLRDLRVLTPRAEQRLLRELNDTARDYPRETLIHGFFEQQAAQRSDAPALSFEERSLSYRALDEAANRLAHLLVSRGVQADCIVGVCVPRSLEMVIAQLAILKAGGAYLPLDPKYPAERLKYMLEDAGAKLVLAHSDSEALVQAPGVEILRLDALADALGNAPATRPECSVAPQHLAYVIYTSGSTGKPKGVLVEHQNFANFLRGMDERLTLEPPGVWLCATSIGFDISVLELFGALGRGFHVVLHSDQSAEAHSLPALLTRHAVTHFQCTPSQARLLLSDPAGPRTLSGLREMLVGGEALPADLASELIAALPRGRLLNMYGPTETTIWSTTHHVTESAGSVPIGTPIANTRVYVLDAWGGLCIPGALGELFIGGHGVTRGYHARPDLNEVRFVADPFAGEPGARMYRTGDIARVRPDGRLEFFGRNDDQVKIRGYRIELGEIDAALRSHASVREAAVLAREDRPGDKRLVAYVVCEGAPNVGELRAHLAQAGLPDYMLPQAFVNLNALPKTPNGKLDKRALPAPEQGSTLSVGAYEAPANELEEKVAECWKRVLSLGRVGVNDNFFDLGGHSMLVVRLAEEMEQATGKRLAMTDFFRFPSVRSLATYLHQGAPAPESAQAAQRGSERQAAMRARQGRRG